ncbi:MAG TPA: hypothetical protein VHS31_10735 [Tepidisphaeraceae bacterium]|nr:hypothetical protein [Tepidisphaeraceae bacterium]
MSPAILEASRDPLCPSCGYNLRGLSSNRCPECGEQFDPEKLAAANIPWLKRAAIGTWAAYWQTVLFAMIHPLDFADEIWNAQRLDPAAARSFRRITLFIADMAVLVAVFAIWLNTTRSYHPWGGLIRDTITSTLIAMVFLYLSTDLANSGLVPWSMYDEFAWRRAMCQYCCAPLAFLPLVTAIAMFTRLIPELDFIWPWALFALIIWWAAVVVLFNHVVADSFFTSLWNAISLFFLWLFMAIVALICGIAVLSVLTALSRI